MTEIEFLDAGSQPGGAEPDRDPGPRSRITLDRRAAIVAALWLAAAALAVAAPFQDVYSVTITAARTNSLAQTLDGWGRYGGGLATQGPHGGPRYGPVCCFAAALFLAVAVVTIRWPGRRSLGTGIGLFGAGLLTASAAFTVSQYRDVVHIVEGIPRSDGNGGHADLGGCVWLTVASAGCAAVALVATRRTRRAVTPTDD